MKECKIIHINDGDAKELTNGNWHMAEEYVWTSEMLNLYLNAGYTITHVVPEFSPGRPGDLPFYKDGFAIFLERESGGEEIHPEEWEKRNVMSPWRAGQVAEWKRSQEESFCVPAELDFEEEELK